MRSCVILCGGRSRRMGQDKGLMILEEKPVLIHLLETMDQLVDEIILVLRDKKQVQLYQNLIEKFIVDREDGYPPLKLVIDLETDQGPLLGLLTGLSHIKAEGCLVLPCDSPFVSDNFIKKTFQIVEDNPQKKVMALVPKWSDGSVEPLHSYYLKECLPYIEDVLNQGLRDVKSLLKYIDVDYVSVEILDPEKNSFRNLNRPEDLK
ncbi:MAG: molybdenum cofactor guanylyltransferase [Methanobacterium sp.]|jgi:molybdopterin-guanine dinucleotide biosynthesis protein A